MRTITKVACLLAVLPLYATGSTLDSAAADQISDSRLRILEYAAVEIQIRDGSHKAFHDLIKQYSIEKSLTFLYERSYLDLNIYRNYSLVSESGLIITMFNPFYDTIFKVKFIAFKKGRRPEKTEHAYEKEVQNYLAFLRMYRGTIRKIKILQEFVIP